MEEGQRLQFYCGGSNSIDRSGIVLWKNGVLFSDGRLQSRISYGVGSISFASVNVTDSGIYQCVSGNITSNSIFVNVVAPIATTGRS